MKKILFVVSWLVAIVATGQPVISFEPIVTGLSQPIDLEHANGLFYIVQKGGTIRLVANGNTLQPEPFLNITPLVKSSGGEQGLLSMALHPNYATNGYFYVYYTNHDDNVVVARYSRTSATKADSLSSAILMTIFKPFTNHNGGKLLFGPDGYLYFGTGDGGSGGDPGNRAQNGDSILGKMIRIDVNNPNPPYYSIPPTNPYINNPNIRDEIIALGLRNPWRWSFDAATGDMWIADVGQNAWEEVNMVPAASILDKNYGWPCFEGNVAFRTSCPTIPNLVSPVFVYPHNNTTGGFSITGGYVYRGTEYPFLQGYYLATDFVSGNGWLIKPNGSGGWNATMQDWINGISSFGEDESGNLYAVTLNGGTLYKVQASDPLPVKLVSFTGKAEGNIHKFSFEVQNQETGDVYVLERRTFTNIQFEEISRQVSITSAVLGKYSFTVAPAGSRNYYRLKIESADGQTHYSHTIMLGKKAAGQLKAVVVGNHAFINYPVGSEQLNIYDGVGRLVKIQKLDINTSQVNIALDNLPKGVLHFVVDNASGRLNTSIVR